MEGEASWKLTPLAQLTKNYVSISIIRVIIDLQARFISINYCSELPKNNGGLI